MFEVWLICFSIFMFLFVVNNLAIRFLGWEDEEKCPSVLYLVGAGLAMGVVITLVGAGVAL